MIPSTGPHQEWAERPRENRPLTAVELRAESKGCRWGLCDRCTAAAPVTVVGGEKRCPTCAGPDAVTKRSEAA